jgi:hypothetical protein
MRSLVRYRATPLALGVATAVWLSPVMAWACAVCVGSSPEDQAYYWSVLFLMGMPFAVGGSIGGWLFYRYRRAQGGRKRTFSRYPVSELGGMTLPRSAVVDPTNGSPRGSEHTNGKQPLAWMPKEGEN